MFSANSSQVSEDRLYVEDVFSTYLYRDTNNYVTVNNGIDLLNKGGMVWLKFRNGLDNHRIADTARGAGYIMGANTTAAQVYESAVSPNAFYNNGFRAYSSTGDLWTSWTFRKAAKFFDVVTVTGQPTQTTFNHNLGVAPGCIIIKDINNAGTNWFVYHRSTGSDQYLQLESTNGPAAYTGWCTATSTSVTVKSGVMGNGNSFVVYLFAHDTTSDGIIQCGSYTTDGSGSGTATLGWEPQWVLIKQSNGGNGWRIYDTTRSAALNNGSYLSTNDSAGEGSSSSTIYPTSTGFQDVGAVAPNATVVYIAIRRGLMRTPTSGASVFQPVAYTATNVDNRLVDTGILTDMVMARTRDTSTGSFYVADRLRGNRSLGTVLTDAENTDADSYMTPTAGYGNPFSAMNGFGVGNDATRRLNYLTQTEIAYAFRRASGFFDEVCYSGTGTSNTITHNLGVVPELIIIKCRANSGTDWPVWIKEASTANLANGEAFLNKADEYYINDTVWSSAPTATQLSISTSRLDLNSSGLTYVAYLFASAPGVSKIGKYTGNGSSQTINCGFAAGARFVLIKRTDTTGNWVVFDTARGITSGGDPSLRFNSVNAEVSYDDIDADSSGFIIKQSSNDLNISSATYIYLAVA